MPLKFHDARTGRLEELRPCAPPHVDFLWRAGEGGGGLARLRERAFVSLAMDALVYLGYSVNQNITASGGRVELFCGAAQPPPGALWLRPDPGISGAAPSLDEARARGFEEADLRLLCLKTHYRKPLSFSWEALEEARRELRVLREEAARLKARGSLSPHPAGLAGYKKRFRDALSRDLDAPQALASLWDALRPGALSPGSQLGALRDADPALGHLIFDAEH